MLQNFNSRCRTATHRGGGGAVSSAPHPRHLIVFDDWEKISKKGLRCYTISLILYFQNNTTHTFLYKRQKKNKQKIKIFDLVLQIITREYIETKKKPNITTHTRRTKIENKETGIVIYDSVGVIALFDKYLIRLKYRNDTNECYVKISAKNLC